MEKIDPENRMLLIVDPQIDFITGTLPVPGAMKAMDALAEYLHDEGRRYDRIVITCDRHPLGHSSFKELGGEWPSHCIESSVGAAIWPAIMTELTELTGSVRLLYKGEDAEKDEYSIFMSAKSCNEIDKIILADTISEVDICGLAGDVCVKTTLEDAIHLYPKIHYRILEDFTASLDGGEYIRTKAKTLSRKNG